GDVPGAHHRPRPAALRHVHRAPARLPATDRGGLALPLHEGGERGGEGLPGWEGGHPDRHPSPPFEGRAAEGPRPPDRRRGATLRREAEGALETAAAPRRCPVTQRYADSANAPDVARGPQ